MQFTVLILDFLAWPAPDLLAMLYYLSLSCPLLCGPAQFHLTQPGTGL